jgi:hypothetical protein
MIKHSLANWAEVGCRLLHHGEPRSSIEALRVNTFRRPSRSCYSNESKLKEDSSKACQRVECRILTGHLSDIFCGPAMMSSSSVIAWITTSNTVSRYHPLNNQFLTSLFDIVGIPGSLGLQVGNDGVHRYGFHEHHNHIIFLRRKLASQ